MACAVDKKVPEKSEGKSVKLKPDQAAERKVVQPIFCFRISMVLDMALVFKDMECAM